MVGVLMCRVFDCKVVDNFAIKYATKQDADHLLQALRAKYTISTDWEASFYIGITLNWDYTDGHVDLSMPKYVAKALHKFKISLQKFHPNNKPEYSPHKHVEPNYGQKVQYAEPSNANNIQFVFGSHPFPFRNAIPTISQNILRISM